MRNTLPFMIAGTSSTIATTSASQAVDLGVNCGSVYLANIGSGAAFINFGMSTVVAVKPSDAVTTESVGNMCIPAAFYGVIGTGGQRYIAAVSISGATTTLRITPGEGFL
jgi:hypothetical protein